jgi:hypothetical protein
LDRPRSPVCRWRKATPLCSDIRTCPACEMGVAE